MYIFSNIEDQITLLVWGRLGGYFALSNPELASLFNYYPYISMFGGLISPLSAPQPLFNIILSIGLSLFSVNFFNFLLLLSIFLNAFFTYQFLKKFKYGAFLTFIFVFSSFFWSHFGRHLELLQVWCFPVLLNFLSKHGFNLNFKKSLVIALFISIMSLISIYWGFFLVLLLAVYYAISFLLYASQRLTVFIGAGKALFLTGTLILILHTPLFFNLSKSSTIFSVPARPYEDFFTFSLRPWYFITPSQKNPVLGGIANYIVTQTSKSDYFLADDYFADEHQASFFGYTFLSVVVFLNIYLLNRANADQKKKLLLYNLIALTFFLFALPPFFTISGITIYTPGYIFSKYFTLFRATARMSVIIHLCLLISLAYTLDFLHIFSLKSFKYTKVLVAVFVLITLVETFIPVKIQRFDKPPEVYTYLRDNVLNQTRFIVYPYSEATAAFFWLPEHRQLLVNPQGVSYIQNGKSFSSENFTKSLATAESLANLPEYGQYIVVFKSASSSDINFFINNLDLVKEFDGSYIFTTSATMLENL